MVWLYLIAGFILLLIGGEVLVKGAVAVAGKFKVPPLIIGIVLVGFGTSVPELVTCIKAAIDGAPDIAVGNVVGSNIANILLVAGTGALLIPVATPLAEFKRDGGAVAIATIAFVAVCLMLGEAGRFVGGVFLVMLMGYLYYAYASARKETAGGAPEDMIEELEELETFMGRPITTSKGLILTFGGIALTVFGAKYLVDGAIIIAENFGVSETVIGLTIVALGTSLPELATAVIAGVRGHSDVSLGNILGSNIYNILAIMGTTAIVQPLRIPPEIIQFDLWVMVGATVLLIVAAVNGMKIARWEGGVLLAGYIAYMYSLYLKVQAVPVPV